MNEFGQKPSNYQSDLATLKDKFGVAGTIKYLQQFDNGGSGDYTKEKYLEEDISLTKEEILEMF